MLDKYQMRKLHYAIFYYLLFISIPVSLIIFGNLGFLEDWLPSGTADSYMYEFDRRVERFKAASSPRVVIVGASYAAFLGESDTIYNLGLATGTHDEQYKIARKYISSNDTVLYVFGLPDLLRGSGKSTARLVTHHDYLRRLSLAHTALSSFVGISAPPVAHPLPSPEQVEMLRAASGLNDSPKLANALETVRGLARHESSPTLTHLKDFQILHPNTIFLYHPPLKIAPIEVDNEFAEKLRHASKLASQAQEMLQEGSFPYIDLSAEIHKSDYLDLLHLSRQASAGILEELPVLLGNRYSYPKAELKPYEYGTNIEFGRKGNYFRYQGNGWSEPEGGFTWTDGQTASLVIPVGKTDSDIELRTMLLPFVVAGKQDSQTVDIYINDEPIGRWVVTNPKMNLWQRIRSRIDRARRFQEQTIIIPGNLLNDSKMTITFQLPDATMPSELRVSGDERSLGIAVRWIVLTELSARSTQG